MNKLQRIVLVSTLLTGCLLEGCNSQTKTSGKQVSPDIEFGWLNETHAPKAVAWSDARTKKTTVALTTEENYQRNYEVGIRSTIWQFNYSAISISWFSYKGAGHAFPAPVIVQNFRSPISGFFFVEKMP